MADVLADELFGVAPIDTTPYTAESTTPSGTVIEFSSDPRGYTVNGVVVPSVTDILGCLDKPALTWWGMKIGVAGTLEMAANGALGEAGDAWPSAEEMVELLTANKLTVNHVRDKAGERGTSVHRALEDWAKDPRFLPNPEAYPEEERGYVAGLVEFLTEAEPIPVAAEVMVGSVVYDFAGRYDVDLMLHECELVKRRTPTGRLTKIPVAAGLYTADAKTSKGVYESHHLQLAGYRLGRKECGYETALGEAILHLTADGHYEWIPNVATPDDFLCVRRCYEAMVGVKERTKVRAKAA